MRTNNHNTLIISKMKTLYFIPFLLFCQLVCAQSKSSIIQATSKKVTIKDGDLLKEGNWTIVPDLKPDIYVTSNKRVTFYTDIDSISFKIKPNQKPIDFTIVLNGKDSAWTQIQYQKPYLETLRNGKKYNHSDTRLIPPFIYQPPTDSNLIKIRQLFHLDSIAGNGNEISRILNLCHWVHNSVTHDGNSENPDQENAIDLISVCRTENRGINCRMLAVILNECYLSLGMKSRIVTCKPREVDFDDCHVINMVYSNDLKKWVWIDPTFDAYVMNERGELLSIQEVRERLINGKTLILNPDANWNRKFSQTKEEYLFNYMAKNLYRLECSVSSEFNYETWTKGKNVTYIELVPLDGVPETQLSKEITNSDGIHITIYKTNNPDIFWTKP